MLLKKNRFRFSLFTCLFLIVSVRGMTASIQYIEKGEGRLGTCLGIVRR